MSAPEAKAKSKQCMRLAPNYPAKPGSCDAVCWRPGSAQCHYATMPLLKLQPQRLALALPVLAGVQEGCSRRARAPCAAPASVCLLQ